MRAKAQIFEKFERSKGDDSGRQWNAAYLNWSVLKAGQPTDRRLSTLR